MMKYTWRILLVALAGIDEVPDEEWMVQQAKNLTDPDQGVLKNKQFLFHDPDTLLTKQFKRTLKAGGVRTLKMPKQSPNLNAYSERFVQTVKNECTDKMIFFSEKHLRHVLTEFTTHYNEQRPHQGLDDRRIVQSSLEQPMKVRIFCRERVGGLLKSYCRKAA